MCSFYARRLVNELMSNDLTIMKLNVYFGKKMMTCKYLTAGPVHLTSGVPNPQ